MHPFSMHFHSVPQWISVVFNFLLKRTLCEIVSQNENYILCRKTNTWVHYVFRETLKCVFDASRNTKMCFWGMRLRILQCTHTFEIYVHAVYLECMQVPLSICPSLLFWPPQTHSDTASMDDPVLSSGHQTIISKLNSFNQIPIQILHQNFLQFSNLSCY